MLDFDRNCVRMNSVNDNRRCFGVKNREKTINFRAT